ncbi:MAG: sulfatase-like hydrolase/transferase, partial [bacterium]
MKFNRREFILTGLLGTGYAGTLLGAVTSDDTDKKRQHYLKAKSRKIRFTQQPGKRPHIFLITVDMISPDNYLPSRDLAGHVNLPNIKSLADNGIRFDNALTTSPLCGPARAALFTGTYPPYLTNGERAPLGMKLELDKEDIIFQEYLRRSGYNTKHVGKCHVGIEKFMDAFGENDDAWNRWAPPLTDDDDYVAFLHRKGVKPPKYTKELRGMQIDRKTPGNSLGGWIQQTNGSPFPKDAHYSVYLAEKALAKVKAAQMQTPNSPVYLQLNFFDPHQPFSIPAGFKEREVELRRHIKL